MNSTEEVSSFAEDSHWMREALREAERADRRGEVPVGAVVVGGRDGFWAGLATPLKQLRTPRPMRKCWPCAKPPRHWGRGVCWRRRSTSLWNPALCALGLWFWPECRGWSLGAADPKAGACGSLRNVAADPRLNHRCQVRGGVLERECAELLKGFFRALRAAK